MIETHGVRRGNGRRPEFFPWWIDIVYIILGIGFYAKYANVLGLIVGGGLAAFAAIDLILNIWGAVRRKRTEGPGS